MQIKSVSNVKIDLLLKKFNKQVTQLKNLGMNKDEIVSELYTTILMCGKNFDKNKNVSFYNYLHSSIQKNLHRLIGSQLEIRECEKSIDQDFGYTQEDPLDIDFICYMRTYPVDVVDSISKYLLGEINESELLGLCATHKIDSDKILNAIDSYYK